MARVLISVLTEISTSDTGEKARKAATVDIFTQTEMYMRASGWMTCARAVEFSIVSTGTDIVGTGSRTTTQAEAKSLGLTLPCSSDTTRRGRKTDMESSFGRIDPVTRAISWKTSCMEMGLICGMMEEATLDSGNIIPCMARGLFDGLMALSLLDTLRTIGNKEMGELSCRIIALD